MVILSLIFFFLAGVFWACFNAREYYGLDTEIFDWLGRHAPKLQGWYIGGEGYNQGFFFTADFKHQAIMLRNWTLIAAGASVPLAESSTTRRIILLVLGSWMCGNVFEYFQGYVFPIHKKGSFLQFIVRAIKFWE